MKLIVLLLTSVSMACSGPTSKNKIPMDCISFINAASQNDTALLRSFIERSVDINCTNKKGETALLAATHANAIEAARLLINAGANVNIQDNKQDSPLLFAGAEGRVEILQMILKASPDFKIYNRYGGTALIPAAERGHVEVVKLLLKTRIDVNHINKLGWTALLEATLLSDGGPRHQQIVQLLTDNGAILDLADKDGITPLQHATKQGYTAIVQILKKAGAKK